MRFMGKDGQANSTRIQMACHVRLSCVLCMSCMCHVCCMCLVCLAYVRACVVCDSYRVCVVCVCRMSCACVRARVQLCPCVFIRMCGITHALSTQATQEKSHSPTSFGESSCRVDSTLVAQPSDCVGPLPDLRCAWSPRSSQRLLPHVPKYRVVARVVVQDLVDNGGESHTGPQHLNVEMEALG